MSVYRDKILITYKYVLEVHEELLTRTINVGMPSEQSEVDKVFAVGDTNNAPIKPEERNPFSGH